MKTLCLLFALLSIGTVFADDTPSLVIEIFRHGIRTPESPEYDDSWDGWGYGELTPAGMRQQYMLGQVMKTTYPELLIPYTPSKIYVQATTENRTIVSALSQLYGIYNGIGPNLTDGYSPDLAIPPYNHTEVQAVLDTLTDVTAAVPNNFYPIPVHSYPKSSDYYLQSYLNCPAANVWFQQQSNDSTVQDVYAELSDTVKSLEAKGLTIEDFSDFDDLGDTVLGDHYNNVALPGGIDADSQEYKDLIFFTTWYEIYPTLAKTEQRQWFSGPFLHRVIDVFNQVKSNTTALNFAFYAAKETMMSSLLSALGIMTPECLRANWEAQRNNTDLPYPQCIYPMFAANLIFEYYNTTNPYVVVKYDGDIVRLCNNATNCSLGDFTDFINNVTDNTDLNAFLKNCQVSASGSTSDATGGSIPIDGPAPSNNGGLTALDYVLSVIILLLVVSLVMAIIKLRSKNRKGVLGEDSYTNLDLKV